MIWLRYSKIKCKNIQILEYPMTIPIYNMSIKHFSDRLNNFFLIYIWPVNKLLRILSANNYHQNDRMVYDHIS